MPEDSRGTLQALSGGELGFVPTEGNAADKRIVLRCSLSYRPRTKPRPSVRVRGGPHTVIAAFPQSLAVAQPSGRDLELGKEPADFSFVANAYAHIHMHTSTHSHTPPSRYALDGVLGCGRRL